MNIAAPELAPHEREEAHKLWNELFGARTRRELRSVTISFHMSPVSVQIAIGHYMALAWRWGYMPSQDVNPFV